MLEFLCDDLFHLDQGLTIANSNRHFEAPNGERDFDGNSTHSGDAFLDFEFEHRIFWREL